MIDATPGYSYVIKDLKSGTSYGEFDQLTGGEMKISTVEYNLAMENGTSTTRFLPGQTSFAPLVLTRALDPDCQDLYDDFMDFSNGKVNTRNLTITMIQNGAEVVNWNLFNVVITEVTGFLFNKGFYTEFRLGIQPEWIEMEYL